MILIDSKNMKEQLDNKHILVDTCVTSLIFAKLNNLTPLLNKFAEKKCTLCISQFIYLELIRICKKTTEKDKLEKFLKDRFWELPFDLEINNSAKVLFPLYNFCKLIKNNKQVSVVDVLNIAFLKKYSENLLLITLDHNDYPLEILSRIYVGAIDLGNEIKTWGIYKFNKDGFEKLNKYFNK